MCVCLLEVYCFLDEKNYVQRTKQAIFPGGAVLGSGLLEIVGFYDRTLVRMAKKNMCHLLNCSWAEPSYVEYRKWTTISLITSSRVLVVPSTLMSSAEFFFPSIFKFLLLKSTYKNKNNNKMSSSAFTTASSVFLLLELYGVFELFYRREVDTNMMLGAFKGYVELKDSDSSKRLLHFYADWVGNNKLIMCLLLLSTMISSDPLTKLLVSLSMSVGQSIYVATHQRLLWSRRMRTQC